MKEIIGEQSSFSPDYSPVNSVPAGTGTPLSKLLNGVVQASLLLGQGADRETALWQALEQVGMAVGADRLFVLSQSPESRHNAEPIPPFPLAICHQWVSGSGRNHATPDPWQQTIRLTLNNPHWQRELAAGKSFATGVMQCEREHLRASLLGLPIAVGQQLWGCLALLGGDSRHWSTDEETALRLFATHLGQAWQNAALSQDLQSSQWRLQQITTRVPGILFQCRQDGNTWAVLETCGALGEIPPQQLPERLQDLLKQQQLKNEVALQTAALQGIPWRWHGEIHTIQEKLKGVEAVLRPIPRANGETLWDGVLWEINHSPGETLRERETRLRRYNQVLMDVVRRQSLNAGDLQQAIREILSISAQELAVARASLWLFTPDQSAITCFDLFEHEPGQHSVGMQLLSKDYPHYFQALQTTRTMAVADVYGDPRTQDFTETYFPATGITSLLDAPIWMGHKLLGTICYEQVGEKRFWTIEEEHFVGAIADLVSLAIESVQRHWAEVSLRDSEEKFSKAFNSIPDPITLSTLEEGQFIDVNESFLRISGYGREEVIGQTSEFLGLWQQKSDRDRVIAQLKAKQPVSNQEYTFHNQRGETWIGLYSAEIIQLGGKPCLLSIVRDITERKQAEAALQESEAKFKKAFRCSPHPIVILTLAEGRYVDVNEAYLQMTGFQRQDVIGRTHRELNLWVNPTDRNPADGTLYNQVMAQLQREGVIRNWELFLQTHRGQPRLVLFSAELVAINGTACMLCMANDMTERWQAEHQLRESEAKFSKAFLASPDCLAISTLEDGRYLEVNETLVRTLGLPREAIIGKTSAELNIWVNPQDRDHLRQTLSGQGAARDLEYEFRNSAGEVRVGLVSAEIIQIQGTACILSLVRDITERKQSEIQMQLAARRDRLLAETLSRIRASLDLQQILHTTVTQVRQFLQADRVYIAHQDQQGELSIACESVAPLYSSVLAWQPQQPQEWRSLLDSHQTTVVEDGDQEQLKPDFPPILREFYQQYQVRSLLAVPIRLPDQGVIGSLVVNQCAQTRTWQAMEVDLLEQLAVQVAIALQQAQLYSCVRSLNSNLEQQVAERTQALAQKMEEVQELYQLKDLFLHAVSHDLRTPVMGWLLVLNNLLAKESSSPGIEVPKRILERMAESSDRQLHLINSLLEVHSSEAGGILLDRQTLPLQTFIPSILEDLDPLLGKHQATRQANIPADLPPLWADPLALRRVFENLLTNALHHNPPGLTLTLAVAREANYLRCTIQDNGVGIPPEQCQTLFELYRRGQGARQSTGIGLGLYLCRQIIIAHGGEIGVVSTPGAGTTFWFTLPLPPSG